MFQPAKWAGRKWITQNVVSLGGSPTIKVTLAVGGGGDKYQLWLELHSLMSMCIIIGL